MIELKHVTKSYDRGAKPVVEDISFSVERGKIHGLIGPNGSGKTTLIKCITGILVVDSGEILLDGKPVYDNPEIKKRMGYVADYCNFFPKYRVKDMIKFYDGMFEKFDGEEFEKLNEIFQIPVKRKIGHLSKGQKMRTSFMLNMALNPDVLVLDEPTSGLDAIAKEDLLNHIVTKVEYGEIAVIISTHHLYELEKICDTVTMLGETGVKFQGNLDEVKAQISKYQVVFKNGLPDGVLDDPRILSYSNIGSVYTFLWDRAAETAESGETAETGGTVETTETAETAQMGENAETAQTGGTVETTEAEEGAEEFFGGKGADLVEQTEISLEELFIYSNRRRNHHE